MAEYNLYIDESGEFRRHQPRSVVAGVLEDCAGRIKWDEIRSQVADVLPCVPYPFHATDLVEPAAWVAAALMARPTVPGSGPTEQLMAVTAPAVELVNNATREERENIAGFLNAVSHGRMPKKNSLIALDGWLQKRSPGTLYQLRALRDDRRDRLEQCWQKLLSPQCEHLVAVAAVADQHAPEPTRRDSSRGAQKPSTEGGFTGERLTSVRREAYVRALETVFERVLCLLRGKGSCRLNVWVASRDVDLKGYGSLDLSRDAIREVVEWARRVPALPVPAPVTGGGRRRRKQEPGIQDVQVFAATGVTRFDAGSPMGLVVADFVSNRLFHELKRNPDDVDSLNGKLEQRIGLRLEMGPRHPAAMDLLPSIAFDGEARGVLRRALAGESVDAVSLKPALNRVQAQQWSEFAAHARETAAS